MKFLKIVIIYIISFIILYNDLYEVGPLKVSQIWKILLVIYLSIIIFSSTQKFESPLFVKISLLRSFKCLINGGIFTKFLSEVFDFHRYVLFYLFCKYLQVKKYSPNKVNQFMYWLAVFVILSFLPFHFELLDQRGKIVDYSTDFKSSDVTSFIGLFQGGHAASITLAFSNLFLIYCLRLKFLKFRLVAFAILLLGVYFQYLIFVRTGYAILIIGATSLFFTGKLSFRKLALFSILAFSGLYVIQHLLISNEAFHDRIFDIRYGNQESVGSGRISFWIAAYELWVSGNIYEMLFGFGLENLLNFTYDKTGLKVFAHNEFFTQLAQNGIIGLSLVLFLFYGLFKYIYKKRNSSSFTLSFTFVTSYLILMFVQGGFWFFPELFLSLSLYKLRYD